MQHFSVQSQIRAQTIVDELFPPGMPSVMEPGSSMDMLVARLSQEMIDDYPASDPRWAESLPSSKSCTFLDILVYISLVCCRSNSAVAILLIHQVQLRSLCVMHFCMLGMPWCGTDKLTGRIHIHLQVKLVRCIIKGISFKLGVHDDIWDAKYWFLFLAKKI